MRTFFNTLRNIFKIEDLRGRIVATLGLVLVYRLGAHVVLPGIDPEALVNSDWTQSNTEGIMGLLNLFTGGAFANVSFMALGIMPYISASIVIQLLGVAVPYIQKLQKEGESGRNKINQLTRWLTIAITAVQGPGYIAYSTSMMPKEAMLLGSGWEFTFVSMVLLSTGTLFAMWLGEKITDRGIGNGISLLIMIGIIAVLPTSMFAEVTTRLEQSGGGLVILAIELVVLLAVILLCILLVQGTRKIPIAYPRQMMGQRFAGARQYIPLKINASGVMPIIFAQAIMFVPMTFVGLFNADGESWLQEGIRVFSDPAGFWYNFVFFILVVVFTYFYTAITVNPDQMAADMKRSGATIYNLKPGKQTAKFLNETLTRLVLPGSIFLAIVAILPAFAMMAGVDRTFAQFYGGTSLLIMVGVVLDTVQQINAHLLNRHYDGLMKKGRRVRSGM